MFPDNNFIHLIYTDYETDSCILYDEVPIDCKLNNRPFTLKLLTILKIVMILDKYTSNSTSPVNNLPLPYPILLNIEHELDYQRDVYFNKIIEPTITYNYPNEF